MVGKPAPNNRIVPWRDFPQVGRVQWHRSRILKGSSQ